jgi:transposase InsO family protein
MANKKTEFTTPTLTHAARHGHHREMSNCPPVEFSSWRPWRDVNDRARKEVNNTGAYLLARFEEQPPNGPADPACADVFYIGKSHGRTNYLQSRLRQFGDSARYWGEQRSGHYAAWEYPKLYKEDRVTPPTKGPMTASAHVVDCCCDVRRPVSSNATPIGNINQRHSS